MTERTIEHVQHEIIEVDRQYSAICDRRAELYKELDALKLAAASHPWIGRAVIRTNQVRGHGTSRKTFTQRGTVAAFDPTQHRRLRGLGSYGLEAGEPIVIHPKGNAGWRLFGMWGKNRGKVDGWELIGEQEKLNV